MITTTTMSPSPQTDGAKTPPTATTPTKTPPPPSTIPIKTPPTSTITTPIIDLPLKNPNTISITPTNAPSLPTPTPLGYPVGVKREMNKGVNEKTVHLAEAHTRVFDAFSRAFSRQNVQFEKAIQSLDSLNDQIVEFIFSGTDFDDENGSSPKQREALKSSMALMRRLLVDAQTKFRKMVEDNKQLASRIDGDLQTAHQEVNLLRLELADTNRRITQLHQAHNHDHNHQEAHTPPDSTTTTTTINGSNKYHSESSSNQLAEELSQLRLENEKLSARNRSLQSEVEELRRVKETIVEEDLQLKPRINEMTIELTHAKEALSALKADRKRLKAEKFDLLNQMKQLYATLEDKEKELRDFIRNYEQRMKESDESLRHLAAERDETEREKWNILKHARDESERVVKLSAQLGLKEATVKKLQEELEMVRKQLSSVGYYSDAESVRTNGLTTPTASTPACSPLPLSTPTPTPNGRGSSADSGVRLSSDRDSTASHDGTPTITVKRGSLDCDTLSVCSSATAVSQYFYYACGAGTPKESPSLSPLYATPVCLKREDQGGDNTPTSTPTSTAASVNSPAVGGLANSSASAGGLSRSAEQLCERLSEAAETSKVRGTNTLSRKSHKSGGTWGSISRVFARQKKRAALDASLYDGNASDKRASWSPSSSLCASPLTEESYSEKLRLLEEAQHIPLERWKAPTVLAWLEVTLGMPQYGAMCAENVRSGKVLLELSDSELEAGLGIAHPMHRKKLRLAIEELREPRLSRFPRISILGHTWVSSEWLPDLGLPQYCDAFANNLVDGRLLEALTKKELEKHLGVHRKFHQASIIHGVHLLRIVRFDRQVLAERRRQCEHIDADPVVWTNMRWVRWARSIDLAEYADNLKDSGVHGALVVLESSFTSDTMATALGIPQSKNIIRRHLATELEGLVNPARQQLDEQARYAKMERRRQEKLASGGSLGRSFSRSYGTGLEKGEKDKRRASLREWIAEGSLSRALGLRLREEAATGGNNGGESSSSGGQSPAVIARTNAHRAPRGRPRSTIMPSGVYVHHETHRRVKSIGDIETITVTPV
ncbi:kazrin-like isoform X5 [Homarus americanus]|uniref:kazrin-like isoform X5 n=1 Tax=Homarus americanus TaxID=6706 RepID=UPI001C48A5CD|nr:kazrin-like isoform X5 [Homarus americanus]